MSWPYTTSSAPQPRSARLGRVDRLGQHDLAAGAEAPRRIGQRLAVVAGGRGHHAAAALLRAHPGQQVEPAAHLESTSGLHLLVLEHHLAAGRLGQRGRRPGRGGWQVVREHGPGGAYRPDTQVDVHVLQGCAD
jgi:hypothetical protein